MLKDRQAPKARIIPNILKFETGDHTISIQPTVASISAKSCFGTILSFITFIINRFTMTGYR